jgi:beta-glucanase (GH16 family)
VPQPLGIPGDWNLVLNSEFTGSSLDRSIWTPGWYGSGITDSLNKFEADCYNSKNLTFPGDGTLHMNVTAVQSRCGGIERPYTGALISSSPYGRHHGGFQYTYGVLEVRVYLPPADRWIANWPAVWTDGLHWPIDGEDDVLEGMFGTACFHFHSLHFAPHGPGGCDPSIRPGWHTFASDWQPGSVAYYYDGEEVGQVTEGVTAAPMFIIIDNTVWKNTPKLTRFDAMRVAYVRVWKRTAPTP